MVTGGFFKLIFYLFIAYIAYLALRSFLGPSRRTPPQRPPRRLSGNMVKDEVCNTYLPQEDAVRANVDGTDHFFCSRECRDKFVEQAKKKAPGAV
jgi:YHS domain-containing protein